MNRRGISRAVYKAPPTCFSRFSRNLWNFNHLCKQRVPACVRACVRSHLFVNTASHAYTRVRPCGISFNFVSLFFRTKRSSFNSFLILVINCWIGGKRSQLIINWINFCVVSLTLGEMRINKFIFRNQFLYLKHSWLDIICESIWKLSC